MTTAPTPAPEISWKAYKQDVRDAWDRLVIALRPPAIRRVAGTSTTGSPSRVLLFWSLTGYLLGFLMAGLGFTFFRAMPLFLVLAAIPAALPLAAVLVQRIMAQRAREGSE